MKRSRFNLSHYNLLSLSMGKIYPIDVTEVLPGDSFKKISTALVRAQPMLAPVMHPIKIRIHHWFVPNRILWDDWEDFITGGPDNISLPEFPKISKTFQKGDLGDYFGLPVGVPLQVNALPFRAYNMIFNEFYRDEDLVDERVFSTASGFDSTTDLSLASASWRKDYFTTARPWTQKGNSVGVPINTGSNQSQDFTYSFTISEGIDFSDQRDFQVGSVTDQIFYSFIDGSKIAFNTDGSVNTIPFTASGGSFSFNPQSVVTRVDGPATLYFIANGATPIVIGTIYVKSDTEYWFKFSNNIQYGQTYSSSFAGSFNIRDLRAASAIQRFNEHRALFGSRYIEYLRFLGVKSSDARLQRPEFLGGGSQLLQISEVLQTGVDNQTDTGVGNMSGHGISAVRSNRFKKFFEEHGYILSFMFILPANLYTQGVNKMWSSFIKEDFFQPELASIGEEEILTKELFADGSENDFKVFGYSHRYQRYRTAYSKIHGDFRDTLDYWHLARKFDSAPVLNSDFITANPSKRIFAEQTTDSFLAMVSHNVKALRIVPKHSKNILK